MVRHMSQIWAADDPPLGRRPIPRRTRLGYEVASYVRDAIFAGRIRPGQRVTLASLGQMLGVSTTPVREGLFILESEGLTEVDDFRGFRVAEITRQDIVDLFEMHAQAASELAARAVSASTPEFFGELMRLQDATVAAVRGGDAELVEQLNHEFHRTINLQPPSAHMLRNFLKQTSRCMPRRFYGTIDGWPETTERDHAQIIRAFLDHNTEEVRSRLLEHMRDAGQLLAMHLERAGVFS